MKIMVSACLLGRNCKYNGGNNLNASLMSALAPSSAPFSAPSLAGHEVIPVCPEVSGGLPIPRLPAEMVDGVVLRSDGVSVDKEFRQGAALCLELALRERPDLVILQSRSPSCGVNQIYDGTFSGTRVDGSGVFASLLNENGFNVIDVEDFNSDML